MAVGALVLASLLTVGFLFPRAGRFLVVEDQFAHAEIGLILSGDPIPRALAARDLYREGRIGQIVVIPEPRGRIEEELAKLGLPARSLFSEQILAASGVPRAKISFLPEPADGTIVEAYRVRRFLDGRSPRTLAVITSRFASRRACFIFRRVLHPVEIFCAPTPYDPFTPDQWWSRPRDALHVATEYQKFLVNGLALAVGWHEAAR